MKLEPQEANQLIASWRVTLRKAETMASISADLVLPPRANSLKRKLRAALMLRPTCLMDFAVRTRAPARRLRAPRNDKGCRSRRRSQNRTGAVCGHSLPQIP